MANRKNAAVERQKFRKKLERWGMPYAEIKLCIEQIKERQLLKEQGRLPIDAPLCTRIEYVRYLKKQQGVVKEHTAVLQLGDDYVTPDDRKHRPKHVDGALKGVGRVTGHTAKAVKRGKTITKYQHDNE